MDVEPEFLNMLKNNIQFAQTSEGQRMKEDHLSHRLQDEYFGE